MEFKHQAVNYVKVKQSQWVDESKSEGKRTGPWGKYKTLPNKVPQTISGKTGPQRLCYRSGELPSN